MANGYGKIYLFSSRNPEAYCHGNGWASASGRGPGARKPINVPLLVQYCIVRCLVNCIAERKSVNVRFSVPYLYHNTQNQTTTDLDRVRGRVRVMARVILSR